MRQSQERVNNGNQDLMLLELLPNFMLFMKYQQEVSINKLIY